METIPKVTLRAVDQTEIAPLVELCKAGHLFDVQTWIASGRPVNSPLHKKGNRARSPLEVAIDRGFHSIVQVLLEGGAVQEPEGDDSPIYRALRAKRFDMVELLVEHGFDASRINMREVFASWDPKIMSFFIDRGADLEYGNPFAYALCNRIRTALKIFKLHQTQLPTLQEQANIALRHHCLEGNLKWVSLLLWAGADPYASGSDNPDEPVSQAEDGLSALEFAALGRHFEIFAMKAIRARPLSPDAAGMLTYLTRGEGLPVLAALLKKGLNPNNRTSGGCSAIQSSLEAMSWDQRNYAYAWDFDNEKRNMDTPESREYLKAIHLLARHGGKWIPDGQYEMNAARRALVRLKPDYTLEFIWIMSKYQACTQDSIQILLRTPTIKNHLAASRARIQELLASWTVMEPQLMP